MTTILSLCLLGGCFNEQPSPLRIGLNSWPGYEFIYLAQEKGFYADEGLDVRLIEFNSLADARRAYERGQIDAFATTVIEVLQVRDHSTRSPQIIQVVDASNGADVILSQPEITSWNDLRGKKIGVELASLGVYVLARALEKNGLELSQVVPVSMDPLSMEAAFRSGELDAAVTYPPVSIKLLGDANAVELFSTAEIPDEVIDVIAVEAEFIDQHPEDIKKFLQAYLRAIDYTNIQPEESYRIMAAKENITPEEFHQALTDGIRMISQEEQFNYLKPDGLLTDVVNNSDRILRQTGQIKGPDRRAGSINSRFATKPDP